MPDILIRGMEMPKNCSVCPFCFGANNICPWTREYATYKGRHEDCPLVELPPHHGDLIERDALETDLVIWNGECGDPAFSEEAIDNAPAVVPAERREGDA